MKTQINYIKTTKILPRPHRSVPWRVEALLPSQKLHAGCLGSRVSAGLRCCFVSNGNVREGQWVYRHV